MYVIENGMLQQVYRMYMICLIRKVYYLPMNHSVKDMKFTRRSHYSECIVEILTKLIYQELIGSSLHRNEKLNLEISVIKSRLLESV